MGKDEKVYASKEFEDKSSESKEYLGTVFLDFEKISEKMYMQGVDLQKMIEDEEKRKIPTLYDFYNEVVSQYLDHMETARNVTFQSEGVVTKAVREDAMFKEDIRNLVEHVYSMKELDKDLLIQYARNNLVIQITDEKNKVRFLTKPGYIRLDHLRKFLRMVSMQISIQEKVYFLWGMKTTRAETREMYEVEETPYLIGGTEPEVIDEEEPDETEETDAPPDSGRRIIL